MAAGINKYLLEIEKELPSSSMKDCVAATKTKWNLVMRNLHAVRTEIRDTVDSHVQYLNSRRDQLTSHLDVYENEVRAKIAMLDDVLTSEQFAVNAREKVKNSEDLPDLQRQTSRLNTFLRNLQDEISVETKFFRFKVSDHFPKQVGSLGEVVEIRSFQPYRNKVERSGVVSADGEAYTDMALCPRTGDVYITGPGFVREYKTDENTSVLKFKTDAQQPAITVNSKGQLLILDAATSEVTVLDKSGEVISKFGKKGNGDGEMDGPRGLTCDSEDKIYITDTNNARVVVFDQSYQFQRNVCKGVVARPISVMVNTNKDLIVTDGKWNKVFLFDSRFRLLRGFGDDKNLLCEPEGVCVDEDGFILVGNNGPQSRVEVFTNDGTHHASLGDPNNPAQGSGAVLINKHNHVFILDQRNNAVNIF